MSDIEMNAYALTEILFSLEEPWRQFFLEFLSDRGSVGLECVTLEQVAGRLERDVELRSLTEHLLRTCDKLG